MPDDMFEKLKAQKNYNAGMMNCCQLYFGQLDMELHSNYDVAKGASGEGESIFDVQQRIASKFIPYNLPKPKHRFLCTFSPIFAGGYSAGYYSYKWAEVMTADAFSAFKEVGLDNEKRSNKLGIDSEVSHPHYLLGDLMGLRGYYLLGFALRRHCREP